MSGRPERGSGARAVARKLALQALYRWQLNTCPWQDLEQEFASDPDMARADAEYFRALIKGVCDAREEIDAALAPMLDREPAASTRSSTRVLLIGAFELQHRPDVPFRVVINEAVGLAQPLRRHRWPQVRQRRCSIAQRVCGVPRSIRSQSER